MVHNNIDLSDTMASPLIAQIFMCGYIFGTFERMMTQRLSKLYYKILFAGMMVILRLALMPEIPVKLQIYHICLIVISIGVDISKENEIRGFMKGLHDKKESLKKFQDLVFASGLSDNMMILSAKNLAKELFKSENLLKAAGMKDCLELLSDLIIIDEPNMVLETREMTRTSSQEKYEALNILSFLQELKERSQSHERISFHAQTKGETYKRIYEVKIFAMIWDKEEAVTVMLNDITEHQYYLGLQTADQGKDKMLAMISHELKTPLNGILGVVNLLQKEIKDLQQLRFLTVCKNSGELLLNLVNSILDLKQIRDKNFTIQHTKDNLHELLTNIYDLFKFQFDQKNLYFKLDISSNVPEKIITDQNRLRQILINLIGNALKFTFEGGVQVNVDLDPERKGYILFRVSDTGTGIKEEDMGRLFKMYGRLEQQDLKTNIQGVGLGLEISNQLAILLGKDGIKVKSRFEEGSSFYFSIRDNNVSSFEDESSQEAFTYFEPKVFAENIEDIGLKMSSYSQPHLKIITTSHNDVCSTQSVMPSIGLCASNKPAATDLQISPDSAGKRMMFQRNQYRSFTSLYHAKGTMSSSSSPMLALRKPESNPETCLNRDNSKAKSFTKLPEKQHRILVVDDNPFNLVIARKIVESLGYAVETVLNGQKAIEEVKQGGIVKAYSAILMDLQMPVMDGYEATRELRRMMVSKEIREMPIIAISANDTEDDKRRCKEAGMYDHLPKPLYEKRLDMVLKRALRRREIKTSIEDIDELRWEQTDKLIPFLGEEI